MDVCVCGSNIECMHVCMYVSIFERVYGCALAPRHEYVCMYAFMYVCMYVYLSVFTCVRAYVCMHVCMSIFVCGCLYI